MAEEQSIQDVVYSEYVDTNLTTGDNSSTGSRGCSVDVSSAREEMEGRLTHVYQIYIYASLAQLIHLSFKYLFQYLQKLKINRG